MFRYIIALTLMLTLSGCLDTLPGMQSKDHTQDPSGIWLGAQTSVGVGVFDMKAIIYDGRMMGISEDAGVMFSGTYEMKEDSFMVSDGQDNSTTSYRLYDLLANNGVFAIGLVGAHITEKSRITGSYLNDAGQEGEIDISYTKLYEKHVSLTDIQGEWSAPGLNITIDKDGLLTGTIDGCFTEGELYVPNEERNLYKVNITMSECAKAGTYDGLGIIMQDDPEGVYFMALTASSERMENFGFKLDTLPVSFAESANSSEILTERTPSATERAFETYTGGNYDGTDFSGQDIHYNITGASYRNASFDNTSFVESKKYSTYCYDSFIGLGYKCTKTGYTTPVITNSDFSGSSFFKTKFGFYSHSDFNGTTQALTRIIDSDFSSTSFTGTGGYDRKFLIKATGTDFSDSTFNNYSMTIDNVSNNFAGTVFKNSSVTLSNGNLEGAEFSKSSLSVKKEGTLLKDIIFDEGVLLYDKNILFDNVTITNGGLSLSYPDADLSGITINSLSSFHISHHYDLSGWNISGAEVTFNAWKADTRYFIFSNAYTSGKFTGTNFSGAEISMPIADMKDLSDSVYSTYYITTYLFDSDFSKADFSNAVFKSIELTTYSEYERRTLRGDSTFYNCNFTAANFANADMTGAEFQFSKLNYANLNGAEKPDDLNMLTSYYGNAWWFNGDRCLPGSVGTCLPVPDKLNTGLTYAEYLSGKDDIDKAAENLKKEAKQVVSKGVGFVKDTGSKASNTVKKIFRF